MPVATFVLPQPAVATGGPVSADGAEPSARVLGSVGSVAVAPSPAADGPLLGALPRAALLLHPTVTTRASTPESPRSDDFMAKLYGKTSNTSILVITATRTLA
jgi:hypothetical protein